MSDTDDINRPVRLTQKEAFDLLFLEESPRRDGGSTTFRNGMRHLQDRGWAVRYELEPGRYARRLSGDGHLALQRVTARQREDFAAAKRQAEEWQP